MNTAIEQQLVNDDGTPRRKYEIEEQEESRYFFRANVGLVLAGIIIYIKNLLFGEEKTEAHIARSTGSRTVGDNINAGDEALEDVIPDKGEKEQFNEFNDDTFEENPGYLKLLFTTTSDSYSVATPYTPFKTGSFIPANDNIDIKMLDAVFDGFFTSFADDGLSNLRPRTGGNISGGGGYAGDDDEAEDEIEGQQIGAGFTDPVYLGSFVMNQAVIIALADFLHNVYDPDGDTLSISELHASSGKITARNDGSWEFSPDVDDTTDVTFTYIISDGKGGTAQTANLDLVRAHDQPIESTGGDDSIAGILGETVINASSGDVTIMGREDNDVIPGGDGDDRIVTGDGDDVVYGGAGNDVVFAGAGRDTVFAGIGNDIVFGEEGDDALFGEAGNDTVSGDSGDDTIAGGEGDDNLAGGTGNDLIDGGAGIDNIVGGEGKDIILAAAGDDTAAGGSDDDLFIAVAGDGNDAYDGGEGTDTYDISATSADATIDLSAGTASSDEIGGDDIVNMESVQSGSGDDTISGGEGDDNLGGGAGNDLIDAGAGMDNVVGGEGQDTILAGTGDDTASGGTGDDLFIAAATDRDDGDDLYDGGEGTDTYDISGTYADAIIDLRAGTASSNEIGDDNIYNIENVRGGSGNDIIFASESVNIFSGGEGNDAFLFGTVAAIGMGHGSRDRILDFAVGDRIDLDDISEEFAEAVDATFEDQNIRRFVLTREQDNFTGPGEIKVSYDTFDGSPVTIIQGNIDYDEEAEFELELAGIYELRDEDFHSHA